MVFDEKALQEIFDSARQEALSFDAPVCILDTNIVLDLLLFQDQSVSLLRQYIENGGLQPVGHYETFYELADVITRTQFKLSESEQKEILQKWLEIHLVYPKPLETEPYCKDHDDDKFFNLARAVQASYLFSKDKKVLKARSKAKRFGCVVRNTKDFSL